MLLFLNFLYGKYSYRYFVKTGLLVTYLSSCLSRRENDEQIRKGFRSLSRKKLDAILEKTEVIESIDMFVQSTSLRLSTCGFALGECVCCHDQGFF